MNTWTMEQAKSSAELLLEGIKESGFVSEVCRLYSKITCDHSDKLLSPQIQPDLIDHKRIEFEGICLLLTFFFFDDLPRVIRTKRYIFFSKPDPEMLYQFRKHVLEIIDTKLRDQNYHLIREVHVTEFDETEKISFGVGNRLSISSRLETYSRLKTHNDLSRKFTMKLAYATDAENVHVLQILGPVFVIPLKKMSALILSRVFH